MARTEERQILFPGGTSFDRCSATNQPSIRLLHQRHVQNASSGHSEEYLHGCFPAFPALPRDLLRQFHLSSHLRAREFFRRNSRLAVWETRVLERSTVL